MKTILIIAVLLGIVIFSIVGVYLWQNETLGPVLGLPRDTVIIDLRNRGLTSLQAEIGEYTLATELLLDDNLLSGALPGEIRKLERLEVLSASNNNLTGIPAEIGQLDNLEIIDLSGNDIDTYPNELFNLQQPLTLILSGNSFTEEQIQEIRDGMPNAVVEF